jgi:uncharacterized membrane protein YkgB
VPAAHAYDPKARGREHETAPLDRVHHEQPPKRTRGGARSVNHIEMHRSGRTLSAILGAVFLVLGIGILVTGGGWKPVVGGILVLLLALDFLVSAATGEWPVMAPWLFLP